MAFSAGTFSLYSPGNPVVTGTTIASTWANNTLNDIATGLSTCVLKDGSQTITANLPMGGFKLTGLASGSAAADSASLVQTQNGASTLLAAVAGTNTITATTAPTFAAYVSGQKFILVPANTNTAATTLQLNSIATPKNVFWNGAACSGGEFVQNVPSLVEYDGTQFNIIGPMIGTRITNALTGDVALNNTGLFFDGPSVAQGTVGTWFASGTVTMLDANGTTYNVQLWDGTTVIASTAVSAAAGNLATASLSGYLSSPAANLRISVKDTGAATGNIKFNQTGTSKDSLISAIRTR